MKKLIVLFVAMLLAVNAYGWVLNDSYGPQNETTCYMIGTGPITSGDVVVLQTTSPTYPGREVTGGTTANDTIYAVVTDTKNYTNEEMIPGRWVVVRTHGYVDKIRVIDEGGNAIGALDALATSSTRFAALQASDGNITGNAVAMEAFQVDDSGRGTISAYLKN